MNLSPEQITEIEEYAACFFTPEEICIIMNLGQDTAMVQMAGDTPFKQAYLKGRLVSEAELRKRILELAKNGSAPAQALALQIVSNSNLKDVTV